MKKKDFWHGNSKFELLPIGLVSGAKTTGSAGIIGGCSGGSDLTSLLMISTGSMVSFVSLVSVSEK